MFSTSFGNASVAKSISVDSFDISKNFSRQNPQTI
jgi:hypothetical protein